MASGPITSWQIDAETMETVTDFFLDSKITANGVCRLEIKRYFLLGRKAMTNLDNILKSRDITLATGCKELIHYNRLWCWERLKAGTEAGGKTGWDGWMASLTRTWVWVNSRRFCRTGKPCMHTKHLCSVYNYLHGMLFFWASKSLQMVIAAIKLKTLTPWKESYDQPRQHIKKQRHYFASKGPSSQGYGFCSSHVWMWELDYKESWVPKNWCFWTVVLEKTLESSLDCKEIQPVHTKGNQSWLFIGRPAVEAETA